MKTAPQVTLAALAVLCATAVLSPTAAQTGPTFYVATNGNNANSGTITSPWRNIQFAASGANGKVVPGSTVIVRGGTYNEKVTLGVSGSAAGGYITFRNQTGETPIIDGNSPSVIAVPTGETGLFLISNRSYLVIQGFDIKDFKWTSSSGASSRLPVGIHVRGSSHHIQIRNNKVSFIENNYASGNAHGIAVYGTSASAAITDVIIDGNEVFSLKLGSSESVVLNGNVRNFEVTNNKVHDNNNIGIDFIGFEQVCATCSTDCTTGNCDQARNGLCADNEVYNIDSLNNPAYGGERAADGIYVDGGRDILIEGNRVTNSNFGIELASEHQGKATSNITVRSNFVSGSLNAGIAIGGYDTQRGRTENCQITNNTLFKNNTVDWSGEIYVQFDTRNNVIKNNIIYSSSNRFIWNEYTQNTGNQVNYNIYYSTSGATAGRWRWKNVLYSGFTAYQGAPIGVDDNSRFIDPKLVSTGSPADLHIQASSPALDSSEPNTVALGLDIDNQPRKSGANVDVGADERITTAPPTVSLTSPASGSYFSEGASIDLQASAADSDGTVAQVEFFRAGSTSLGLDSSDPYQGTFASAPAGSHALTARARDNQNAETTSAVVTITVVGRPTVTATAGNATVALDWGAVTGASSYNVKRSDDGGASYGLIAPNHPHLGYTDNAVVNGTTYRYVVSANHQGGQAPDSLPVTATPSLPPAPLPPTLTASAGDGRVTLSWSAPAGATSYNLTRSTTSGSGYEPLASGLTSASYLDLAVNNGTTYYYRVTALGAGGEGGPSNQAAATPQVTPPPSPPVLSASAGDARVTLNWSAPAGATSYNLSRSLTSGTGFQPLVSGLTALTYLDLAVNNGTTYYYLVTAVSGAGPSGPSNQVSATPQAPPPVTFQSQDIGSVAATGSWSLSGGTHTVRGSGNDIWNTADEFRYVYRTITGNATIVARLASLQDADPSSHFTKGGIMFRESTAAGSKNVALVVTPVSSNGFRLQSRTATNGTTAKTFAGTANIPTWLRLVRNGTTFTASFSSNGTSWTSLGSVSVSMTSAITVGLALTSHNDGTLATALFDNVTITAP